MSGFEFIFSLFGLLLGLALAEALGGLSKALKVRHRIRIGWSTPLLCLFVSCDVVTLWMYGWGLREKLFPTWPVVFGGFLLTGVYFVAASLVFPDQPEDWPDLDAYFERQRRLVLGVIMACNLVVLGFALASAQIAEPHSLRVIMVSYSYFPVSALAIVTRNRRVATACLLWLIALYPLSAAWQ